MQNGVKVYIHTKDDDNNIIDGYGYILRRLTAKHYEIWIDKINKVYTLEKSDFTEINEDNNLLYDLRNKIV